MALPEISDKDRSILGDVVYNQWLTLSNLFMEIPLETYIPADKLVELKALPSPERELGIQLYWLALLNPGFKSVIVKVGSWGEGI